MHARESMADAPRFSALSDRIEAETGLHFPASRQRDLTRAIAQIAAARGFTDSSKCIDWLLSGQWDKAKTDMCAQHLTISETYFFRESRAFGVVTDYARNRIAHAGQANVRLRIWSAGCCTGEEPYSIAIRLRQEVPELDPRQISILATDINHLSLQVARQAVYRQWSFRATDALLQKRYFSEAGNGLLLLDAQIRDMVEFSKLNLAVPGYPCAARGIQDMDIIFCRNVLMYFSRSRAQQVIARFRECMVEGGWLIVNPSEACADLFHGFAPVYFPDAVYFRKCGPAAANAASAGYLQPASSAARPDGPGVGARRHWASNDADQEASCLSNSTKTNGATRGDDQNPPGMPLPLESHYALALRALECDDLSEAIQHFRRVVYLQPDYIIAYYWLGTIYCAKGQYREAARHFGFASKLLVQYDDADIVPGSDGMPAAYLRVSMHAHLLKESV